MQPVTLTILEASASQRESGCWVNVFRFLNRISSDGGTRLFNIMSAYLLLNG